jgi:hypothetical protein
MTHHLLIVSSDQSIMSWRTREEKRRTIERTLNKTNAPWLVTIQYRPFVPQVKDGRITHQWMNDFSYPYFKRGFQHVSVHLSMAQWNLWGLKDSLRGSNHNDDDFVSESYFKSDELTRRGRHNQFVQTCLHEIWHDLCRACGIKDDLHDWHKNDYDITNADWSRFDMNKWHPTYQEGIGIIAKLKAKLQSLLYGKK